MLREIKWPNPGPIALCGQAEMGTKISEECIPKLSSALPNLMWESVCMESRDGGLRERSVYLLPGTDEILEKLDLLAQGMRPWASEL